MNSLISQRDGVVVRLANCPPDLNSLLALRAEAVVLEQMAKDVKTECARAMRAVTPKGH